MNKEQRETGRFIMVRHKCCNCGVQLGFWDEFDKRNYVYHKKQYICLDCFMAKKYKVVKK